MPWNNGGRGSGPWGSTGGAGGDPRKPPKSPFGGGPFGGGPQGGGPFGGGSGSGPPDFDQIIGQLQAWLRRLLRPGRIPGRAGAALLLIAVIAVWLATGFYRVQPDEQGVVLRFGAFVGTTLPGLNYHLPWPIETVERPAVTRINRIEIGFRSAGGEVRDQDSSDVPLRDVPQESLMLTGDENIIDIDFTVLWRIRNAADYLFTTRHPEATVKSAAESVMREVIGSIPIQPALAEARARIETDVLHGTQAILDQYGTGVEITQVQLQKVDPPAAVIDSFRDVQRANTDADRARNEAQAYANDIVPRARGDAAAVVAQAEGARQASIAEATGQAQRFLSVLGAYQAAKDVTLRRLYIETMQDILSHSSSIVVDDRLRGLVPFLSLGETALPSPPPASPGAPAR
jgi:membrane protease subunit HflK